MMSAAESIKYCNAAATSLHLLKMSVVAARVVLG